MSQVRFETNIALNSAGCTSTAHFAGFPPLAAVAPNTIHLNRTPCQHPVCLTAPPLPCVYNDLLISQLLGARAWGLMLQGFAFDAVGAYQGLLITQSMVCITPSLSPTGVSPPSRNVTPPACFCYAP